LARLSDQAGPDGIQRWIKAGKVCYANSSSSSRRTTAMDHPLALGLAALAGVLTFAALVLGLRKRCIP
jgi:hypothetical protein